MRTYSDLIAPGHWHAAQVSGRPLPKLAAGAGGAALIVVGVAGVFLPVLPGIVLIGAGIAVLAREFGWARSLLDRARAILDANERPRRGRSSPGFDADQDGG